MQSRYSTNQKKKKPYIKWILISGTVLIAAAIAYWLYLHDWDAERSINALTGTESQQPAEENNAPEEKPETEVPADSEEGQETLPEAGTEDNTEGDETVDATKYPETIELPEEPTVINGILLANKQHPLPEDYAPGEVKKARDAFEAMSAEAAKEEIDLVAFSTFRNFDRQKELYEGYAAKDGEAAADRYSARPGFSEHQTGLAFDIGEEGQEQHWASASFGDTEGGKWLAENAHRYGFILRYPEDSEHITGYMHESWHYRFVGKEAAAEIHEQGITLEQYLDVQ